MAVMGSGNRVSTGAPRLDGAGPHLRLLGSFALVVDEQQVVLPQNAQKVLAGLSIGSRPRVPRARTTLAERVWADSSPARAQGNLRTALWRIRQADPRLVATLGDQVGLGDLVTVDVHDCLVEAQRLLSGREPVTGSDDLLEKLTCDLLPGWDDDWLVLERERVRQLRLHALEALSSRMVDEGRHGMAVQAALLAVEAEPLRESAQHALIAALLAEGNLAEAHRYYGQFRRLLWRELRLAPSVTFADLLDRHRPRPCQPSGG